MSSDCALAPALAGPAAMQPLSRGWSPGLRACSPQNAADASQRPLKKELNHSLSLIFPKRIRLLIVCGLILIGNQAGTEEPIRQLPRSDMEQVAQFLRTPRITQKEIKKFLTKYGAEYKEVYAAVLSDSTEAGITRAHAAVCIGRLQADDHFDTVTNFLKESLSTDKPLDERASAQVEWSILAIAYMGNERSRVLLESIVSAEYFRDNDLHPVHTSMSEIDTKTRYSNWALRGLADTGTAESQELLRKIHSKEHNERRKAEIEVHIRKIERLRSPQPDDPENSLSGK